MNNYEVSVCIYLGHKGYSPFGHCKVDCVMGGVAGMSNC